MECAFCHFCCDEEGGNAAGVAIFVRENGGQKREENKERERSRKERSRMAEALGRRG
jgi:hypothetical protein